MKNILITGGAGFIGSNVALKLVEKGYHVTVIDILSEQVHGKNPDITSPLYISIKGKVDFITGSITDRHKLEKALDGQEAVIHLAAETGTGQSMYEIKKYIDVNIGGTAMLLDILTNKKSSIKKLVMASSRAIYGEGRYECAEHGTVFPESRKDEDMAHGDFECKCPICGGDVRLLSTTEDSMIHPTSVYGITKHTQEQMVMTVCPTIGIAPVVLRYQNVYGAGQSLSNPYTGILSIFSTRIKNGNEINIFEDGKEYNVGTGELVTVEHVARTLMEKYGRQVPLRISGNYRLGDIRHNYADITLANKKLGFNPSYSFEKGIEKFTAWVDEQNVMEDQYEQSIKEMRDRGLYK